MLRTRSSQSHRSSVAVDRAISEVLEERRLMAVGGGWTAAGLAGTYYNNTALTAPASFTRRDVRIDFDWGNVIKPGGSIAPGYRDVGTDNYSVQWAGQLIPRFTETYTFTAFADDVFKLEVKAAGSGSWTTVIDQGTYTGGDSAGTMALTGGQAYDVRITYKEFTGGAVARLRWSSPSTPEEVIDTLAQSGTNLTDWGSGYTDIIKGARNSWTKLDWSGEVARDANGWPMGDGMYVWQESLNQGQDTDPLMRGTITFSFTGKATVSVWGNMQGGSLAYSYDAGTNTTTGSFVCKNNGWNASGFNFANSTRTGVAGGPGGITNLKLMRPTAPEATTSYSPDSIFTQQLRDSLGHFTVIRYQLVANQQKEWSDRTKPTYFNQSGGSTTNPYYGVGGASNNGASWEHKIMLANETGRDVMFSIPTVASNDYVTKLANLVKYGSDANGNPYTAPTANPVYPPLNPNLRVYFEIENELWNWASPFDVDFHNINRITAADIDARNADYNVINYDNLPTTKNGNNEYNSINTWRFRKIVLRTMQYSDIFRGVFGDGAMPSTATYGNPRIRPLYEWQYDNANDTARLGLAWADRYFNNGDGVQHVTTPRPLNYWLWGGGGATYYGALNGNGLTDQMPNSGFDATALANGYTQNPAGTGWTFTGTAGIARDGGSGDDIPPAYNGSQMGYVTDTGTMSMTFTIPATQTSNVYGFSFKAVNRLNSATSSADKENIRIILDDTIDLTARTFSQGNGCTPPAYQSGGNAWRAQNVFWVWSDYYFTKSFTAAAGSTHKITIKGMGDISSTKLTNQTAFIEDVRLTSVDKIFADGIPGGGEAAGQPAGLNIRNTMNVETNWARAFGLEMLAYEAGWSLGGDDGGSWVQLKAKYGDPRTADAQKLFMNYFYQAGAAVNVFGTYPQWPSWSDYYAEQGLLDVGAYPIVQGIDYVQNHLTVEEVNGTWAPGVLKPATVSVYDNANAATGAISGAGGFLSWTLNVPRTGNYRFALSSTGGGTAAMVVDERAVSSGTAGGTLSGTIYLTRGQHALKVRSTAGTLTVSQVAVSGANAPASPTLNTANDGDASASLAWSSVAGATGYRIRYGTSPGVYPNAIDVGNVTSFSVTGLTNDQQYFIAVDAYNAQGESLPSNEKGVIPLAAGQTGRLVVFEFNGYTGSESTGYGSSSSRTPASVLTRGPGWDPSISDWAAQFRANRFACEKPSYGVDLAGAIAKNQYYTFTMSPAAGKRMSLSQLSWRAFYQDPRAGTGMGITYSTDGVNFSSGIVASGSSSSSTTPWTVDLSGIAALQNTTAAVTFRIYQYGMNGYTLVALGDTSGNDLVVTGAFADLAAVQSASINDGAIQRSMVKKIDVLFNQPVVVDPGAINVLLSSGLAVPNTTISVANPSGDQKTYTLTFSGSAVIGGSLADGIYDLVVSAGGVRDLYGNAITGNYSLRFHRLFGDSDGNRIVNALDYARLKQSFGRAPSDPLFNSAFDYEGNGLINALDLARFRQRYGMSFSY